jgi:hypothetical protein
MHSQQPNGLFRIVFSGVEVDLRTFPTGLERVLGDGAIQERNRTARVEDGNLMLGCTQVLSRIEDFPPLAGCGAVAW